MPQGNRVSRIQIQVEKGLTIPYSHFKLKSIGTGNLCVGFEPVYTPLNQDFEETP